MASWDTVVDDREPDFCHVVVGFWAWCALLEPRKVCYVETPKRKMIKAGPSKTPASTARERAQRGTNGKRQG